MDRLLLVRCDLIDTRWTLRSSGFVNRDLMIAPVLAKGVATYAYIGDVPYEIDLNIIGRRLGIGDLVYFRPGQITIHTKWTDTQRKLTQQGSRLTTC